MSREEQLEEALKLMCEEFRQLDLPYGSTAYMTAISALNLPSTDQPEKDAARWNKCHTMPKAWWIEAMHEASLKGGRGLNEQIDNVIKAANGSKQQ